MRNARRGARSKARRTGEGSCGKKVGDCELRLFHVDHEAKNQKPKAKNLHKHRLGAEVLFFNQAARVITTAAVIELR